ncbi:hypothetical protein KIN20_001222 [Parelaphostrongylus tenuis]|uniref:PIG-P domain-containing protein n=1 Tax=Parelaphostrongylus tenuis TaxID=148309 RepID=A0AAD5LXS7_PARTN|nr:hypothetical protein KIN20_001222 [Parelaphostrongylus tenuis]
MIGKSEILPLSFYSRVLCLTKSLICIDDGWLMPAREAVEDIRTPNPLPSRGIYGFALYISSICFLTLYVLWAVVPTPILKRLGITYVPAKYWVIAIPVIIIFSLTTFVLVVLVWNIYSFGGYRIFEEVEVVENDFGDHLVSDKATVPSEFEGKMTN